MSSNIITFTGAIFSIFYLFLRTFLGPWEPEIDLVWCGILLFFIGIPHGAGDHLIAEKIQRTSGKPFSLIKFIGKYVGIMLLYAILWFFFPNLSFWIFILISIFHFGDLDDMSEFHSKSACWIDYLQIFARGTGILGILIFFHWNEVVPIVNSMIVPIHFPLPPSLKFISFLFYFLGYKSKNLIIFVATFFTLLIGIYLPLVPAFVLFFACCHSIYSFRLMINKFEMNFLEIYKKLFPYSIAAFLLFVPYIYLINNDLQLSLLFIFLSLITLPHFFLMHIFIKYVN